MEPNELQKGIDKKEKKNSWLTMFNQEWMGAAPFGQIPFGRLSFGQHKE
jgi:hypothetical protein